MFYASMKSGGRYELVANPSDADLVFELLFSINESQPQFKLTILDSKTHFALWAFTVYAEPANREAGVDGSCRRCEETGGPTLTAADSASDSNYPPARQGIDCKHFST
jgi:hypothetical protein